MAKRRSQLVVYESQYLVDPINQNEASQSDYKLSCGDIGESRREHHDCPSHGLKKRALDGIAVRIIWHLYTRHATSRFVSLRDTFPMT